MKLKFKSITNLIAKFTPLALFAALGLALAAPLDVAAGNEAIGQYVRIKFTRRYGDDSLTTENFRLTELALYNRKGERINGGLTGVAITSVSATRNSSGWMKENGDNCGLSGGAATGSRLFDGLLNNDVIVPAEGNRETVRILLMHIDSTDEIGSYNLASSTTLGNSSFRGMSPVAWELSVSPATTGWAINTAKWDLKDTRTVANDPALTNSSTWYNGGGNGTTPSKFFQLSSAPYTPVTYINAQTRGPALRITGFSLEADDYIETKVVFNDVPTSGGGANNHAIFCNRQGSNSSSSFCSFVINGKLRFDYGPAGNDTQCSTATLSKDVEYVIMGDGVSDQKLTATAGSTTAATANRTGTSIPTTLTTDLLLFAHSKYDGSSADPQTGTGDSLARMKMYYFRVYDDSTKTTLRLDLVPVKNSSGDVGMYDRVSGNFYKSVTTVPFTAGSALPSFLGQLVLDPRNVAAGADERATGGDIILKEDDDYIHVFYDTTAEQTFTVNQNSTARILAVGGGGAGGAQGGPNGRSGGGGAGGYVEQSNVALQTGDYTLQVGAGGSAVTYMYNVDQQGVSGQSSWLKRGAALVVPEALGGGGGGAGSLPGLSGGSGGGGAHSAGGAGTTGQGCAGGGTTYPNNHGSGGGGAAGAGVLVGGAAKTSDILGTEYAFAGGGGGANLYTGTEYKGGGATISGAMVYVGGSGGTASSGEDGKAGVAGTGSGGGGSGRNMGGDSIHSGAGGSGIVIIRVTSGSAIPSVSTLTVTLSGTSATYTGSSVEPNITVKDGGTTLFSGVKASAITGKGFTALWKKGGSAASVQNAGTYTLTLTGDGSTYSGTAEKGTFTVNRKQITKPTAVQNLVYNGNQQTGVASGTGYTVTNGAKTNAGDYTASVSLSDKTNTEWADTHATDNQNIPWSIAKKMATTPVAVVTTYTGSTQDAPIKDASGNSLAGQWKLKSNGQHAGSATADETYSVTVELRDTTNYTYTTGATTAGYNWTITHVICTCSTYSTWTAGENNILLGKVPKVEGCGIGNESTGGADVLTDGANPIPPTNAQRTELKGSGTTTFTWDLGGQATVSQLRVFVGIDSATWGHANINITKLEYYDMTAGWKELKFTQSMPYYSNNQKNVKAVITRTNGNLFENATRLRITMSAPVPVGGSGNYYSSLTEIEAIGVVHATPIPEANLPRLAPQRTFKFDGGDKTVSLSDDTYVQIVPGDGTGNATATAAGVYHVWVQPKAGYVWPDDESSAPRKYEWGIVPPDYSEPFGTDRSFLKTLENSPYRVAASALPPSISGGDIFLRFQNPDGQSYDFVHVYTNTAEKGFVFENNSGAARQGRALIVGGGGGSGSYAKGAGVLRKYCNAPGGGGGGGVKSIRDLSLLGAYSIVVGAGGMGGSNQHGGNGMPSSIASAGWKASVGGGGGGARSGSNSSEWIDGYSGATGGGGSGYKSADADKKGNAGTANGYDGYDGGLAKYESGWLYYMGGAGGGAGATGPEGGASGGLGFLSDILRDDICFGGGGSGGVGSDAGGTTCSGGLGGGGGNYNDGWHKYGQTGVCGLGGGGGAPGYTSSYWDGVESGRRGGDGIVIIRYTDTVQAPKIKTVVVPEVPSFVYNHQLQDTGIRDTEDYTVSDDVTGMYIQEYTITLTLRDPDNMQWSDGTTQPQHIKWYIRTDYNVKLGSFYYGLSTNHTRVASDPANLNADFIFRQRVGENYRYVNIFTNTHASVAIPSMTADILLVGGGGGGGAGLINNGAGGGGAGGVVLKESQALNGTYSITIGAGGSRGSGGSAGGNGGETYLSLGGSQVSGLIAHGGGGGAGGNGGARNGKDGASGGGAAGADTTPGGTAGKCIYSGEGHDGGSYAEKYGGGGGGAGAPGGLGTAYAGSQNGGNGVSLPILGYNEYFGGGGAGQGGVFDYEQVKGGLGGGGNGVWRNANPEVGDGMDGQGGGGGSSGFNSQVGQSVSGGRGGCGLVVIVYSSAAGKEIDKPVLTKGAHTFTGSAIDVTDSLTSKDHLIFNGTWSATNVGTYTFTAQPEDGYCWTGTVIGEPGSQTPIAFEWSIIAKPIQGNITVSPIPAQTYTGSPITPEFEVRDTARNVVLTLGTDYTAEYVGNVNIGTATIRITGAGNYTGVETATFQIVANANEQGYYVTPDADGSGDGLGWETPTTLAGALTKAQSATKPVVIYMKEGTYTISSACSLSSPGQDVKIMGGYTGVGLARSQNFSVLNGGGTSGFLLLDSTHAIALQQLRFTNGNANDLVRKSGTGAMTVEHCLFDNTRTAPAITVAGGQTTVENCTFYKNSQGSITATGSSATVKNSIMWTTSATAEARGSVTLMYTLVPDSNQPSPVVATGTGVIHSDPKFVDADHGDFHLQSTAGHYTSSGWVPDKVSSPAIDAGDPTADCSAEPKNSSDQNFGLNLGVYGNTAQASMSPVRANVTVTFEKGEGTGGTASVKGLEGTAMPAVTCPMRENYKFMGYFAGTGGTGVQYYDEDGQPVGSPVFPTTETTLYANWEENIHYIARPTQETASWTYDGQDHRPSFADTDGYTVAYSAATPWKNASDAYTVTFTLKNNWRWNSGTDTSSPIVFTYKIKKVQLYVVPDDETIAYGDAKPTLTYHLEGFVNDEDATSAGVTGAPYLSVNYSAGDSCGRYQMSALINGSSMLVPNPLSAPNYSFGWNEERTGYLTVTQRVATLSWANLSFVYDGTEKAPTCTIGNLYDSDAVSATVAVDDGPAIQPGTYTARVTGLTGDKAANYSLPATVTKSFTIVSESVILDDNGGDEGEGSVRLIGGAPEKATVTRPFYNGYSFRGYWTTRDGGSQVYDQTGALVANPPTLASGDTIYAHWEFVETYYLKEADANATQSSFVETKEHNTAYGWRESDSAANSVRHTVANGHNYVAKAMLHTPSDNDDTVIHEFKGESLTLTGSFAVSESVRIGNLISSGGGTSIYTWGHDNYHFTIDGAILIDDTSTGKRISFVNCGKSRTMEIAASITGSDATSILLQGQNNAGQSDVVYIFSGDASAFEGKWKKGPTDIPVASSVYFTGNFGGSVESFPTLANNVRFRYEGLPEATRTTRGLIVSNTSPSAAAVQNNITFYGSSGFTTPNFPLMTFPAGTTVNPADFTVKHAETVDGAATPFTNLGKIVNGDNTVTLVANVHMIAKPTAVTGLVYNGNVQTGVAEGEGYTVANGSATDASSYTATATLKSGYVWSDGTTDAVSVPWSIAKATNAWAPTPALSATTFAANRPATITWGVAQFGGQATATLDGQSFTKTTTLPANLTVESHTLVFTVAETSNYTGLSKTIDFTVTDALYDLHAISATGPVIKDVPSSWLSAAFPTAGDYQAAFISTNVNGVTGWAAYILGFEGSDVPTAAIIEKTTQSTMSDNKVALTIALPDLPTTTRAESAGCTLAYSLLTSTDAETLRTGGGDVVDGCLKISSSSFTVPLSIPTDANHVYYRIRIHFIFAGGDDPEPKATVFYTYSDTVDPDALPSGWAKEAPGPGKDNEYYVRTGPIDIPAACLDDGYVRVSFKTTVKYNGGYFTLTFLDENGQQLTAVDSLKVAVDSLATAENGQLVTKVYRVPAGANVQKIHMQWADSNSARAKKLSQDFSDVQVSNIKVESLNYLAAASEVDAIFGETVDSTAYATAKATYFDARSDNADWTRGLQGLHDALVNGGDYDILVMGDSLAEVPFNGAVEALIKRQWPQSNVRVHVCWNSNSGCTQFAGSGYSQRQIPAEDKYKELLEGGFAGYDCVIFSGTSQARCANSWSDLSGAITTINNAIKEKNPNCSVVFLAPQLSVDSRYYKPWTTRDSGSYSDTANMFYAGIGQSCAARTDWSVETENNNSNIGWAWRDYCIMSGGLPTLTKSLGMAYWDLYEFAYDYLFRSGKPYFYYSRDAQHANEYNRVLSAKQLFEVFKLVAAKDFTTP